MLEVLFKQVNAWFLNKCCYIVHSKANFFRGTLTNREIKSVRGQ